MCYCNNNLNKTNKHVHGAPPENCTLSNVTVLAATSTTAASNRNSDELTFTYSKTRLIRIRVIQIFAKTG